MASYRVIVARSARKELERLPRAVSDRVLDALERLQEQPRPLGSKKLRGSEDLWRVRIGDYRVVYAIADDRRVVDVLVIRHRRDVYR